MKSVTKCSVVFTQQRRSARLFSSAKNSNTGLLNGVYPPIPTLFNGDGSLAVDKLSSNLKKLLSETDSYPEFKGLVVLGSNGEYPTLSHQEKKTVLQTAKKAVDDHKSTHKRHLIAGTGSNSTSDTIEMTNAAADMGYDAALVITPYYFKPQLTDEAYVKHFTTVAEKSKIPILVYNVPTFTGVDLSQSVIQKLSQVPNIIGIKESSGNVVKISQIVIESAEINKSKSFQVMAGSGSYLHSAILAGGSGGVMALCNVYPRWCAVLHRLASQNAQSAAKLQSYLVPVNQAVTRDFGIAGLKYAMEKVGYVGGNPRLPLLPLSDAQKLKIDTILNTFESQVKSLQY